MKKNPGLDCILLIEDDRATNFIHQLAIRELGLDAKVKVCLNGREGLDYLTCDGAFKDDCDYPRPGIIFLDINMPLMDGWEFLEAYNKLDDRQKGNIVLMMVSSSTNPDDQKRALHESVVSGFIPKPLTSKTISEIIKRHFPEPA